MRRPIQFITKDISKLLNRKDHYKPSFESKQNVRNKRERKQINRRHLDKFDRTNKNKHAKEISTISNGNVCFVWLIRWQWMHIALWDSITTSITLNRLVTPEIDQSVDHRSMLEKEIVKKNARARSFQSEKNTRSDCVIDFSHLIRVWRYQSHTHTQIK